MSQASASEIPANFHFFLFGFGDAGVLEEERKAHAVSVRHFQ